MLFDPKENNSSQSQFNFLLARFAWRWLLNSKFGQTEGLFVNRSRSHTCATFLGTGQLFIFILTMALFLSSRWSICGLKKLGPGHYDACDLPSTPTPPTIYTHNLYVRFVVQRKGHLRTQSGKQLSASQWEAFGENNLIDTGPGTSSLGNREKINICILSHLKIYDALLWPPKMTRTITQVETSLCWQRSV